MKLPNKYKQHVGQHSYDLPKQLLGESDHTMIEVVDKDGECASIKLGWIDWRNVTGWVIEEG